MVNFGKIIRGELFFITGFISVILLNMILPSVIDVGESIMPNTDIAEITWFFMILLFLALVVVMPCVYIIQGLQEPNDQNRFVSIFIAILMFLVHILLTVKGWYAVETFTTMATDGFTLALFWIGFAIVWILSTIITPIYIIVKEAQV